MDTAVEKTDQGKTYSPIIQLVCFASSYRYLNNTQQILIIYLQFKALKQVTKYACQPLR